MLSRVAPASNNVSKIITSISDTTMRLSGDFVITVGSNIRNSVKEIIFAINNTIATRPTLSDFFLSKKSTTNTSHAIASSTASTAGPNSAAMRP